jgi:hypothetical protein
MSQSFPTALIKSYSSFRVIKFPGLHRLLSRRAILAILAVAVIVLLGIGVRGGMKEFPSGPSSPSSNTVVQPPAEKLVAELVTLTETGFAPSEIVRPMGTFLLVVDNRSGMQEVEFRLDRVAGGRVHQARISRHQVDWMERFTLPPGTYLLSEANRPEWTCRLTVTAR